jgi:hypothetical protein
LYVRGFAGNTPLHLAALYGQADAAAALLEAGASVAAVMGLGHTCLSLAAHHGHTATVRQLLQAWQAPPADVLRISVEFAAKFDHWDAAVLLVRQLGKQNMAAAAEMMQAMPLAVPALLDAVLGSKAEQQAVALQDEARQLAEQRRGLQVLVLGLAGTCKPAATGLCVGPCTASCDKCGEGEYTAGAADGVSTGVAWVPASAAAAKADDAGCVSVAGSHCRPEIARNVNKRKRRR